MALAGFPLFQTSLSQVFSVPSGAEFAGLGPQPTKAVENFLFDFWEKRGISDSKSWHRALHIRLNL